MIEPCIFACDPGISGAIAFFYPATPDRVSVEDVPVMDNLINGATLGDHLRRHVPTLAIIEDVNAMPPIKRPGGAERRAGTQSSFNFGRSFGTVIGVIQGAPVSLHYVKPAKWKKHFGLSSDKEEARALAINLFPKCEHHFRLKKHAGRAEAALLARYAAEVLLPQQNSIGLAQAGGVTRGVGASDPPSFPLIETIAAGLLD